MRKVIVEEKKAGWECKLTIKERNWQEIDNAIVGWLKSRGYTHCQDLGSTVRMPESIIINGKEYGNSCTIFEGWSLEDWTGFCQVQMYPMCDDVYVWYAGPAMEDFIGIVEA